MFFHTWRKFPGTTVLLEQFPEVFESLFILHIDADYMQVYHIPMSWKPAQVQYDQRNLQTEFPITGYL